MSLHLWRADARGNATVLFALGLPALLAVGAAAMLYAYEVKTETALQAAIDAGALAGTALGPDATERERINAALVSFSANFTGKAKLATGKSDYVVASDEVKPVFTVSKWEVSGVAVASVDNPLSGILGKRELKVTVRSSAAKVESLPICVLGLNPDHDATIDMTGQPVLYAENCAVQANSRSGKGMSQKGKPAMTAKIIGTSGGFSGGGYAPAPIKGVMPFDDPFAHVPFPPAAGCDYKDVSIKGKTVDLSPGVYCGGIRINSGGLARLSPGIYVIKDGPLWLTGGGSIEGEEVTIAFTGPDATLYMNGSSKLELTSPVSGDYANMQFMQQPGTGGDDLYFSVIGNNVFKVDGAVYLPTLDCWFGGGSEVEINSANYALVADKIWMQDQTDIHVTQQNRRGVKTAIASGFKYGARLTR